jgi:hypothetical protein
VCFWSPLALTKVNKYRSPPGLGYFRIRRQAKTFFNGRRQAKTFFNGRRQAKTFFNGRENASQVVMDNALGVWP